ncbi:MAG TPA: SRPBCC domain-containing protein [Chitinophagaceae bacterium]|nr:SRPBCC domain-containing protein [Chitinophagaceae bacterium]
MVDINHRIGIKSSADQVYKALSTIEGLANWWTEEVEGDSTVGGRITFTFRSLAGELKGSMIMEVQELIDQKSVRWRCIDGPAEWMGTDITFQLSQHGDQTIIIFGHRNWREAIEFTAHCSMKWAVFLLSLRQYVETGEGKPSPRDVKIDDWN